MPTDLTPIEELDQNILSLCTRINAATYELLVMIREFDEDQACDHGNQAYQLHQLLFLHASLQALG